MADELELSAAEALTGIYRILQRWCVLATTNSQIQQLVAGWASFKSPKKTDFDHLVEHDRADYGDYSAWLAPAHERRRRDGFALTDHRADQREVQYEVDHCIYCHERDTDSCSKGMRNKRVPAARPAEGPFQGQSAGCHPDRLPAGRENLRDARHQAPGRQYRRPCPGDYRQSHVPRHRPSHLQ
ncbi:MAG: hypothetical protein U5P41_10935 [Gammaproteobacteria bacterium]|nr:hypothetical protein [Gammaproteobacteria bacterium]